MSLTKSNMILDILRLFIWFRIIPRRILNSHIYPISLVLDRR